jgi:CheY-like chemotaxis protein
VAGHEDGRPVLNKTDRAALIEVGFEPEPGNDGSGRAAGAGPGRRVLVVDDDAVIRMICAINLKAEGFSVIEASDGREGLELARSERPDLIVTDVKMPRCDGFEFTEMLRRDEKTREIPVVFMTGDIDATHEARAHGLGVLAFLAKPFDPRELIAVAMSVFA